MAVLERRGRARPHGARSAPWFSILACVLVVALGPGCRQRRPAPAAAPPADAAESASEGPAAEWVTIFDPRLASPGYMLTLHDLRVPVLLDLNGRPVHTWPAARLKSRVRLLPDGSLLGIGLGRQIVEYDWEGRETWVFRTPGAIPHHDVLRLANGHTLVLLLREGEGTDTLLEVDRAGKVVWTWRAAEHRHDLLPERPAHADDVTHINSLEELPDNPWFAAGDRRFRPGNLLLSARNLNTVFILDRQSGQVVWTYGAELDRQHEARMTGPGLPQSGRITVFNNRLGSFWGEHQTELLELDPTSGKVLWRFKAPGFFSPTSGAQQVLPNGNLLVTSTRGGRVFEITREGRLAWEWAPPYEPVRSVRVAADACPQLARLAPPALHAVVPPADHRHVDPDAYRFARQGSRMDVVVSGEPRTVLKEETDCRTLTLPAAAKMQIGYGVDHDRLRTAGRAARPPRFAVRLHPEGAPTEVVLLADTVGLDGPAWRQRTLPLDAYGRKVVELCVEIDGGAPKPAKRDRFAYWEQPFIDTADHAARRGDGDDDATPKDLTAEELEVRRQHLKSLGYIN
jgi:hypothetical protein